MPLRWFERPFFSSLTSQYLSRNKGCDHHCRYPLFDSSGQAYDCNIHGKQKILHKAESLDKDDFIKRLKSQNPKDKVLEKCAYCDAESLCKQCKNAKINNGKYYCEFVKISKTIVDKRTSDYLCVGYKHLF